MRFHEVLGSPEAPYPFVLRPEKGQQWHARPPWPDLVVLSNTVIRVSQIEWQRVVVRASTAENSRTEDVQVLRLVATLDGGAEVEMSRISLPAEIEGEEVVDPTKCAACGRGIPAGAGTEFDGRWYHTLSCMGG
jgi:hypothetical protein